MIRLIHTSDLHLDACYAEERLPAAFGNRRRQSLRDVLKRILERAVEWPADAVLIAGDLFEIDRISRDTVAFLQSSFENLGPVPVFIAPGNHDPYTTNSPYRTESWPSNVTIFSTPAWQRADVEDISLTVHGFAFDSLDISQNPFGSLQIPQDGRVHVALGHGSEMGSIPPGKDAYAPFRATDATPPGLRYLALGHFHGYKQVPGPYDATVAYSGAPEGHGFGETGERYFLEVEIDEKEVRVRPVTGNRTVYVTFSMDCSEFTNSQQIVDAIREHPKPNGLAAVARVTLTGNNSPEWRHEISAIRDALSDHFEYLKVVDATVELEDYLFLAREHTSLGAFIAMLNAELDDTPDLGRRQMLLRAREVGLAAYRGRDLAIEGAEGE